MFLNNKLKECSLFKSFATFANILSFLKDIFYEAKYKEYKAILYSSSAGSIIIV
jgi:hypothetical protein